MNEQMDQNMLLEPAPAAAIQANISGAVSGQVAVGSYILQIGSVHGGVVNINLPEQKPRLKARPTPVSILPRRFSGLLDRVEAVGAAAAALPASRPVELNAECGSGKTTLLRVLARHPLTGAFPDGVVYLSARGQVRADLLQSIFDSLFEYDAPYKPSEGEIRLALQNKRALILLDDVDQSREDVEALFDAAPECVFLLGATERKLWGEGLSLAIPGLPVQDARSLLEQQLGRPFTADESAVVEDLINGLNGRPLALIQAAALVRDQGVPLPKLAAMAREEQPERKIAGFALALLSPAESRVASAIAAFDGAPLNPVHLPALTGTADVQPALAGLQKRGLVVENRHGFTLAGAFAPAMLAQGNLAPWRDILLDYFRSWASQHLTGPQQVPGELDGILRILETAGASGKWGGVLELARAADGALALSRRWGAWEQALQHALQAAETLEDLPAKAWALHQLGTRLLSMNEKQAARGFLVRALQLREALGDQAGAAVTRHNLRLLFGPAGGDNGSPKDPPMPPTRPHIRQVIGRGVRIGSRGLLISSLGALFLTGMVTAVVWGALGFPPLVTADPMPTGQPPIMTAPAQSATPIIPVTDGKSVVLPTARETETPAPIDTPQPRMAEPSLEPVRPTETASPADTPAPIEQPANSVQPQAPACIQRTDWLTYIIRPGDTLWSIARSTGTTVQELIQAGCLPGTRIIAGLPLLVPRLPVVPGPGTGIMPAAPSTTSAPPDQITPEPPTSGVTPPVEITPPVEVTPTIESTPETVITPPTPLPPDLVITSFQVGPLGDYKPGIYSVPYLVTVANQGEQAAGAFEVVVSLSGAGYAVESETVDGLAPVASSTLTGTILIQTDGRGGSLSSMAAADPCDKEGPCRVVESNENNNQAAGQPLDLPNQPPSVKITNPEADTTLVYDGFDKSSGYFYTVVALQGSAVDPEDGTLPTDALVWSSDQKADLGPGRGTEIKAVLFSPQCDGVTHVLTLTATDHNGAQNSVTRRITLKSKNGC